MNTNTITTYPVISDATLANTFTYDYLSITPVPSDEKSTQVGTYNEEENILECNIYINQLIRTFGEPPVGVSFFILKNTGHNEGFYYDIAIRYNDNDEATDYVFEAQTGCKNWDDTAKQQLTEEGYSLFKSTPVIQLKRA